MARRVADEIFLPLTVGGGIRSVEDMRAILLAGADKVSENTLRSGSPGCSPRGGTFWLLVHRSGIDARRRPRGGEI